jgi:hypothetical protein
MALPRKERFELFLQRLEGADPADSAESALALLRRILNEVEDEHSGVPYNPDNWQTDGRLYPPLDDRVKEAPGRPGMLVGSSLQHLSYFGANGAIQVYHKRARAVVLDKPGADGKLLKMTNE